VTNSDTCTPKFSYNLVNGTYSCENKHSLTEHLKGKLNFSGWVMSDWGADHGSVLSLNAGACIRLLTCNLFRECRFPNGCKLCKMRSFTWRRSERAVCVGAGMDQTMSGGFNNGAR
jgi:hypothetical protein